MGGSLSSSRVILCLGDGEQKVDGMGLDGWDEMGS